LFAQLVPCIAFALAGLAFAGVADHSSKYAASIGQSPGFEIGMNTTWYFLLYAFIFLASVFWHREVSYKYDREISDFIVKWMPVLAVAPVLAAIYFDYRSASTIWQSHGYWIGFVTFLGMVIVFRMAFMVSAWWRQKWER
jgi:hypothetical protein